MNLAVHFRHKYTTLTHNMWNNYIWLTRQVRR